MTKRIKATVIAALVGFATPFVFVFYINWGVPDDLTTVRAFSITCANVFAVVAVNYPYWDD